MQVSPYLAFDGQTAAAFQFYEQIIGGKTLMMMTVGDSPMADSTPVEQHAQVLHARMAIGETLLMASDSPPGRHQPMQGVKISLDVDDVAEAERIFAALAEGGTVQMPIAETFWAERFGMATDRFGTPWMVNCERLS